MFFVFLLCLWLPGGNARNKIDRNCIRSSVCVYVHEILSNLGYLGTIRSPATSLLVFLGVPFIFGFLTTMTSLKIAQNCLRSIRVHGSMDTGSHQISGVWGRFGALQRHFGYNFFCGFQRVMAAFKNRSKLFRFIRVGLWRRNLVKSRLSGDDLEPCNVTLGVLGCFKRFCGFQRVMTAKKSLKTVSGPSGCVYGHGISSNLEHLGTIWSHPTSF